MRHDAFAHLIDYIYVYVTFICTGKPRKSFDSLNCDIRCMAGVLEPCLSGLQDVPVLLLPSHPVALLLPSLCLSLYLSWAWRTDVPEAPSFRCPFCEVLSFMPSRLVVPEVCPFGMSPCHCRPPLPEGTWGGEWEISWSLLCLCHFYDLLQPLIPQTSKQIKNSVSSFSQNSKTIMHINAHGRIPVGDTYKPVTNTFVLSWKPGYTTLPPLTKVSQLRVSIRTIGPRILSQRLRVPVGDIGTNTN